MPNHISAEKRVRQDKKRQAYNRYYKVMAKRAIKDVKSATTAEEAEQKLRRASQILDRIADRGIVHKNYAANHKSKLAAYVNKLKTAV
ncbi:MAG: 30S ribosomal protein S20 [Bacteroidota bacterium]|nr:30S ribosomal protein S20 [Candidatus Kapabacteria bacterium]MDW8220686.1 30S ribosomal protein S20 [Bacteroidota bacterium]